LSQAASLLTITAEVVLFLTGLSQVSPSVHENGWARRKIYPIAQMNKKESAGNMQNILGIC
jgi:hypothetical protein